MGLVHFNTVAVCIINGSNTSENHYDWSLLTISEENRSFKFHDACFTRIQTHQVECNMDATT